MIHAWINSSGRGRYTPPASCWIEALASTGSKTDGATHRAAAMKSEYRVLGTGAMPSIDAESAPHLKPVLAGQSVTRVRGSWFEWGPR
jgi:hypothetical protein